MIEARRVVLASRPAGDPETTNFRIENFTQPEPGPGQVLLRTLWLSLDPYMRGRMLDGPSYAKPVALDAVMEGGTISEVVASQNDKFAVGDVVLGRSGWQTHALDSGNGLSKIDPRVDPPTLVLSVLGMPGMTAYCGLLHIGKPKAGETVVVAAASGGVGSQVGQIAMIKGARAVGIAGGPEKCRYVVEDLGFDDCVDHRGADFGERLQQACPRGIDVYFENAGGPIFEDVFPLLNTFARVPVCGLMAQFNLAKLPPGRVSVPQLLRALLTKRITIQGFIVTDFAHLEADFQRDMSTWFREGRLRYREDVLEGLDRAPEGLIGLLRGENFGKRVVRVGAPKKNLGEG